MSKYNHREIEQKWQEVWQENKVFEAKDGEKKKKFFCLVEFPYPSGDGLHVGHVRSYAAQDILCRKKRMAGLNVLYPIGWDAFGLPTENYAIKTGQHPTIITAQNVATFKKQIQELGISFDWSREINTTDPEYYKWTQWIFIQLFKKGLAYKKKMNINWCPKCKIGLANEEVVNGGCERCGTQAEKKELSQWMLKITAYADRLIEDLETVDFLDKIKQQQINWIGRSYGAEIDFQVSGTNEKIKVFTTRPDTIFGATFLVLSPEHSLVNKIVRDDKQAEVLKYQEEAKNKSEEERTNVEKEKTGVFIGANAINPFSGKEIPIFIADYVLPNYGTGAIMAVPAHDERDFEFAQKYNLEIIPVIKPLTLEEKRPFEATVGGAELYGHLSPENKSACYSGPGTMINSGEFDGLDSEKAFDKIIEKIEKENIGKKSTQYHLRDWVFSRQHYWGEPIPMVNCPVCGWVPLKEAKLPLELPMVEKYEPTGTGESPLASMTDWVQTTCPQCGGRATRETDTMPNWAGSSWYFLRYIDPKNNEAFADAKKMKYWLPVDLYNGGMEHTTLHLLYSRFWHKVLYDLDLVPTNEPYQKRVSHGMILAPDGQKMSKSRGNVINPDKLVTEFGADSLRLYEMFMGPYDQPVSWDTNGIMGCRKFLERIWSFDKFIEQDDDSIKILLNKTIKKVGEDIDDRRFNTAVSAMMIFVNEIYEKGCSYESYKKFIQILHPFAPHLSEEIWQNFGEKEILAKSSWPEFDNDLISSAKIQIGVQVNGKLRDTIEISPDITEEEVKSLVLNSEKIKKHLIGSPKKIIYIKGKIVSVVI
ncbi:MAG: leucine--tRNA ligase [Patescibacteria group bacterium]